MSSTAFDNLVVIIKCSTLYSFELQWRFIYCCKIKLQQGAKMASMDRFFLQYVSICSPCSHNKSSQHIGVILILGLTIQQVVIRNYLQLNVTVTLTFKGDLDLIYN